MSTVASLRNGFRVYIFYLRSPRYVTWEVDARNSDMSSQGDQLQLGQEHHPITEPLVHAQSLGNNLPLGEQRFISAMI